jgi:antirestriction protein ArdC
MLWSGVQIRCVVPPIRIRDVHTAYIHGWLRALKNDKTSLIQAPLAGQKSCDFILQRKGGEDENIANDSAA